MLKLFYDRKEDIPQGAEIFYTLKEGKYVLLVDGVTPQADVDRLNTTITEERNRSKALADQMKGLDGADPEKVAGAVELVTQMGDDFDIETVNSMKTELDTLKANRNADTATLQDEVIQIKREKNQAVKENGTLKKKLGESQETTQTLQTQINQSTIRSHIQSVAEKAKIIPEAIDDVLMYGNALFELDSKGQVVAKDGQQNLLAGATAEDWIASCQPNKPHWWPRSQSGGGDGGSGGNYSGKNPWKEGSVNLTEQGNLYRTNLDLARSLAKEAGVELA